MSIPAQSGAVATTWVALPLTGGAIQYTCVLAGATDVSSTIEIYSTPINTIHIYGSFNSQNVSVLGSNSLSANGMVLHQADAPSSTFSAVAAEMMHSVIECPRYIYALANGAVTSVTIVVMLVDRKRTN